MFDVLGCENADALACIC